MWQQPTRATGMLGTCPGRLEAQHGGPRHVGPPAGQAGAAAAAAASPHGCAADAGWPADWRAHPSIHAPDLEVWRGCGAGKRQRGVDVEALVGRLHVIPADVVGRLHARNVAGHLHDPPRPPVAHPARHRRRQRQHRRARLAREAGCALALVCVCARGACVCASACARARARARVGGARAAWTSSYALHCMYIRPAAGCPPGPASVDPRSAASSRSLAPTRPDRCLRARACACACTASRPPPAPPVTAAGRRRQSPRAARQRRCSGSTARFRAPARSRKPAAPLGDGRGICAPGHC